MCLIPVAGGGPFLLRDEDEEVAVAVCVAAGAVCVVAGGSRPRRLSLLLLSISLFLHMRIYGPMTFSPLSSSFLLRYGAKIPPAFPNFPIGWSGVVLLSLLLLLVAFRNMRNGAAAHYPPPKPQQRRVMCSSRYSKISLKEFGSPWNSKKS